MVRVETHWVVEPGNEEYAQGMSENSASVIGFLEDAPDFFGSAMDTALLHVHACCLADPQAAGIDTWEAVVTVLQVGSAMFAAASAAEGKRVECRISHEVRSIPAVGPLGFVSAANWLEAFWFAIICRDQKRMTQLCEFPLELMRESQRRAGYEIDEYQYSWVDTLQAYWLRRPGVAEKLARTMELSFPDVAVIAGKELLDHILYQPIALFHRFVTHDTDGFNEALLKALEYHKAYWTADEERAEDPTGTVAIGPLAIACLAYDGEFPLEVESDYIPHHLLTRSWLGEFPT